MIDDELIRRVRNALHDQSFGPCNDLLSTEVDGLGKLESNVIGKDVIVIEEHPDSRAIIIIPPPAPVKRLLKLQSTIAENVTFGDSPFVGLIRGLQLSVQTRIRVSRHHDDADRFVR